MPDTIDRENEKLEEEQNAQESASQADAGVEAAAEGSPNAEQEAPKEEQQPQNEWKPEVTAVQFPRLDAEDLPPQSPNAIPDIPLEDEELPSLEDDKPESMGKLYDFVAKMDDRQFRRAQTIFGCVIGLLGAIALMIPIGESTRFQHVELRHRPVHPRVASEHGGAQDGQEDPHGAQVDADRLRDRHGPGHGHQRP